MVKRIVPAYKAAKPAGPYSQVARAGGLIFVSGQLPLERASGTLVREPVEAVVETCLKNVRAALADAGASLEDVAMAYLYVTDISQFARINEVYSRFFGANPPARVTVQVAGLPMGAALEIHVIAREAGKDK